MTGEILNENNKWKILSRNAHKRMAHAKGNAGFFEKIQKNE